MLCVHTSLGDLQLVSNYTWLKVVDSSSWESGGLRKTLLLYFLSFCSLWLSLCFFCLFLFVVVLFFTLVFLFLFVLFLVVLVLLLAFLVLWSYQKVDCICTDYNPRNKSICCKKLKVIDVFGHNIRISRMIELSSCKCFDWLNLYRSMLYS